MFADVAADAPTAFDKSMFPIASATAGTSSPVVASGEDSNQGRLHKAKKKKKKNKHKHKHKHRHDRPEKDDKSKPERSHLSGLVLDLPLSSDASNANSPQVTHSQPSSPEFEVI